MEAAPRGTRRRRGAPRPRARSPACAACTTCTSGRSARAASHSRVTWSWRASSAREALLDRRLRAARQPPPHRPRDDPGRAREPGRRVAALGVRAGLRSAAARWRSAAMPWFTFIGHDGPRGAELRTQHRPAHLAGLEALARAGRIRHAGPLLGEDGAPLGSVIVLEAPTSPRRARSPRATPTSRRASSRATRCARRRSCSRAETAGLPDGLRSPSARCAKLAARPAHAQPYAGASDTSIDL